MFERKVRSMNTTLMSGEISITYFIGGWELPLPTFLMIFKADMVKFLRGDISHRVARVWTAGT